MSVSRDRLAHDFTLVSPDGKNRFLFTVSSSDALMTRLGSGRPQLNLFRLRGVAEQIHSAVLDHLDGDALSCHAEGGVAGVRARFTAYLR